MIHLSDVEGVVMLARTHLLEVLTDLPAR